MVGLRVELRVAVSREISAVDRYRPAPCEHRFVAVEAAQQLAPCRRFHSQGSTNPATHPSRSTR